MEKNPEQAVHDYVKHDSQIILFFLDMDGRIIDASAFARSLTGCRPGKEIFEDLMVHARDPVNLKRMAMHPKTDYLFTLRMVSGLPQSIYFNFIPSENMVLAFGRVDIPELEAMRKEMVSLNQELSNMTRLLHKKNARLEQLNREKNQFLGMAAHDLRKPIGLILTYSEFLMEEAGPLLDTEQTGFLYDIHGFGLFMKKLVDDFLDVSAIEAGCFILDQQPADMIRVLDRSLKSCRIQASRKQIELIVETGEAFPRVSIDVSKIEQAVMNLVSNAIEHSEPDSDVIVRLFHEPGWICVSVRDQGPGIPPEDMERLFKPFGKTSVGKTGGEKSTGLGMVITQKIITAHNGDLRINSQPGKGTLITFRLPLEE